MQLTLTRFVLCGAAVAAGGLFLCADGEAGRDSSSTLKTVNFVHMLVFEITPGHGVLEIGDLAPNSAKLGGHQDEVGVVAVDQIEQLLRSPESKGEETGQDEMRR